jgi:RNA polymerase sigma-70 factor (ECF subfamily)
MGRTIDAEEFEALYLATARDILAYVRRRTSGDADDLVAEVYAVAWRRRSALPAPLLRRAWLFGVARTLLKAAGRRQVRDRELLGELATRPETEPEAHADADARDRTSPVVAAALARLASHDREVLQLVAWEGLTPAELAVALGVRPGTARVRLHRARQALASDPGVRALVEEPEPAVTTTTGRH